MQRLLRTRLAAAACALSLGTAPLMLPAAVGAAPAVTNEAKPKKPVPARASHPVSGTVKDAKSGKTIPFHGKVSQLKVENDGQQLYMTGVLQGTKLPGEGVPFRTPLTVSTGASPGSGGGKGMMAVPTQTAVGCDVLNLDLGPLNLDLLGLVVDLQPVVLDVTAVPGAGNLLGNLVCAVAGLLDGGGPLGNLLNGLTTLLNQILAGLGLAL